MADRRDDGSSDLDSAMREHAAKQVKATSEEEVLKILRADGITTLEELVKTTLSEVNEGLLVPGKVAKDTFIYTQAIYKKEMPVPDHLKKRFGRG